MVRCQGNPKREFREFENYFSELYGESEIKEYLALLRLPKLKAEHKDIMEDPITETEISRVIKQIKTDSAPGPNYKTFQEELVLHLKTLFGAFREAGNLDQEMSKAFSTTIPKPEKDLAEVGNYRPISLIHNDLKLITNILADRLKIFIPEYIHRDQVGFIPGRQVQTRFGGEYI